MSDMVCDNCGTTEAVVNLTQIVNNQMSTHSLCEKCAAEKGLESSPEAANLPLTDFLAQMGTDKISATYPEDTQCSFCGLHSQILVRQVDSDAHTVMRLMPHICKNFFGRYMAGPNTLVKFTCRRTQQLLKWNGG